MIKQRKINLKKTAGRAKRFCAAMLVAGLAAHLSVGAVPQAQAQSGQMETIAAVVNDRAISTSDVNDRMRLVMTSSGLPKKPDIMDKLRPQILNALIEEQLKVQEAGKFGLEVDAQEIEQGFATIAQQNNMTADQFKNVLKESQIPRSTLEDQIRAQISWTKLVQMRLRPQIDVSETDIDSTLDRLEAAKGKTEYRIFEIFLPVNTPDEEGDIVNLARKLHRELIEKKAPFQRVAAQFSQSAGATNGGDLGWVQEGQLAEEIDTLLQEMPEGTLSEPIRTVAGYHIILLAKKREITEQSIPSRDQVKNQLSMQRLDRMQRRYLMDLKSEAFVEQRV